MRAHTYPLKYTSQILNKKYYYPINLFYLYDTKQIFRIKSNSTL